MDLFDLLVDLVFGNHSKLIAVGVLFAAAGVAMLVASPFSGSGPVLALCGVVSLVVGILMVAGGVWRDARDPFK